MCAQGVSKTHSLHLPPKLFLAGQPLCSFRSACVWQVSVRNSILAAYVQHTHSTFTAYLEQNFTNYLKRKEAVVLMAGRLACITYMTY